MTTISTPCVKICVLDDQTGFCEGCGRTRSEVARWLRMSEWQRRRIMTGLPQRLAEIRARRAHVAGVEGA
ncbi:DUF1289 domain-containing protein [Chelatococcus sp. SYSU_G07232]|uniref:DUF1289 domain-containing protein n=1 Tax=Chelatococcus albus TaxID=3047466 RepID=A0ABT7AKA4_9HYPH|nr:DUF1289 domain-containing protein [Chelatococcus sp. SYSU_G07232]MDJ1159793.1 DUF1289 domain-containing protein [Chelatococcus sp. SYSU_G07232]